MMSAGQAVGRDVLECARHDLAQRLFHPAVVGQEALGGVVGLVFHVAIRGVTASHSAKAGWGEGRALRKMCGVGGILLPGAPLTAPIAYAATASA